MPRDTHGSCLRYIVHMELEGIIGIFRFIAFVCFVRFCFVTNFWLRYMELHLGLFFTIFFSRTISTLDMWLSACMDICFLRCTLPLMLSTLSKLSTYFNAVLLWIKPVCIATTPGPCNAHTLSSWGIEIPTFKVAITLTNVQRKKATNWCIVRIHWWTASSGTLCKTKAVKARQKS